MAFTAGFSVNVGDPTKASDVDVLAANDDYLKNAIDTFIANDANNRVLTGTGSGTANAETNLTFDGSTLTVTGTVSATTFSGNVTGNLTGDVTGNISGNVTGGTISGTTGTFSGDVAVNTSTLKVDTANNRVSIGTASPDALLHLKSSSSSAAVHSYTQALIETSSHSALQFSGSTSGEQWIWFADDSSSPPVGGITYYHGGPYMAFRVEGSTRATLDSTGLGVGTASPSRLLHLSSTGGTFARFTSENTDDFSVGANANGFVVYNETDADYPFVITNTGNVGINTVSPKGLIDIDSTGRNAVADLGDADDYALVIRNPTSTGQGNGICFTNDDAVHVGGAIVHIDQGSNNTGDLAFYTRDTGGSVNEAMRIDNSQRVGIGTSAPVQKLELSGGTSDVAMLFNSEDTAYHNIGIKKDGSQLRFIEYGNDGTTESTNLMVLEANGDYVGIGSTAPLRGLHLEGDSGTSAIRLETTGGEWEVAPFYSTFTDGNFAISRIAGSGNVLIPSGNVGLGTVSPERVFDMVQTGGASMRLKSGTTSNNSYVFYENSTGGVFHLAKHGTARTEVKFGQTMGGCSLINDADTASNGLVIGTQSSSAPVIFGTANTERARITSAGDLLIGTLSVYGTNKLNVNGGIAIDGRNATTPGLCEKSDVDTGIYWPTTNTIAITNGGSESLRIDSSGNVGIGSQSPQYKLVVSNGGAAGYEFNVNGLNSGVNTLTYNRSTSAYVDSAHFVNNYYIYSGQTPAERFRVESTGVCAFMTPNINIRFNGTATQSVLTNNDGVEIYTGGYIWAGRQAASLYLNRAGTTGDIAVFYYNNTTAVGSISVTSSATAYNTSSDYRLKENLVPITGAVDRVNALQPRRFNFISDPDTTVDGFVAHEVSPIVPEAISGEKDAVDEDGNPEYQGIDQSKLVPLLTAAIQELTARIEALEAA